MPTHTSLTRRPQQERHAADKATTNKELASSQIFAPVAIETAEHGITKWN